MQIYLKNSFEFNDEDLFYLEIVINKMLKDFRKTVGKNCKENVICFNKV